MKIKNPNLLERQLAEVVKAYSAPILKQTKEQFKVELSKKIDELKVEKIISSELTISDLSDIELEHLLKIVYTFTKIKDFNPIHAIIQEQPQEYVSMDDVPELYHDYNFKKLFIKKGNNGNAYAEATTKSLMSLFRRSAEMEKGMGKDLYDFDEIELSTFFKSLKSGTLKSLQDKVSAVERYMDFASERGVKDNIATNIVSKEFGSKKILEKLLDKEIVENMIFTRDEVFTIALNTNNAQDGVILALLFDGVSRRNKFEELINLTEKDIRGNRLKLKGRGEEITVSDETVYLLKSALEEEFYINVNGESVRRHKIADGEHVLRGLRGKKTVKGQIISQRFLRMSEATGHDTLNATTITYSGQLYMMDQLLAKGEEMDSAATKVLKKFGLAVNDASIYQLRQKVEKYLKKE